jgi:hypothetical protein
MELLRRVAVVLAFVVPTLAVAVPAHADQVLGMSCETEEHRFSMNAWSFISEVGPYHQWNRFEYQLGGPTGGKSNVNLEVIQWHPTQPVEAETVYWNHSPDNLVSDRLYAVTPPWPVYTLSENWEKTDFRAIFDKFGYDPECGGFARPI